MIYLILDEGDDSCFEPQGSSRNKEKALSILNSKPIPSTLNIYAVQEESETGEITQCMLEPLNWNLIHVKGSQRTRVATKLSVEECAKMMADFAVPYTYKKVESTFPRGASAVWVSNIDNVNLRQYFDNKVHEQLYMEPAEMKYVTPDEPRAGDAGSAVQS